MTESDDRFDERGLVARARAAVSPTAADAQRVRLSVRAALAAGATAPATGSGTGGGHAGGTAGAVPAAWGASKLGVLALTALLAGGAGFWAGRRTGARDTGVDRPSTIAAPPSPPRADTPPSSPPARSTPASESPPRPPSQAIPAHRVQTPPPAGTGGRAAGDGSLDQEVRALRSVERALRDRQPGLALALLAALNRDVPGGKLLEEREAMSVIARCAQGDTPLGVALDELFAERHAGSVYLKRVQQACAAGSPARQRIDDGAETLERKEDTP